MALAHADPGRPLENRLGTVWCILKFSREVEVATESSGNSNGQRPSAGSAAEASAIPSVFVSYSHQDRKWLEKVRVHLNSLSQKHRVEMWDDTRVEPGYEWAASIKDAIQNARVAVLLVSAHFLASEFIKSRELPLLLQAVRTRGLRILWVLVSPCRFWEHVQLAQFQALNYCSTALSGLPEHEQDVVLTRLAEAVAQALRRVRETGESPASAPPAPEGEAYLSDTVASLGCREPNPPPLFTTQQPVASMPTRVPKVPYSTEELSEDLKGRNSGVRTNSKTPRASDLFPRARQIPILGLFFAGCASLWEWVREHAVPLVVENETLRQIIVVVILLLSCILPPVVVRDVWRQRAPGSYPNWLIVYFLCFGIVATAAGGVLAVKYVWALSTASSAEETLQQLRAEHGAVVDQLETVWQRLPDNYKEEAPPSPTLFHEQLASEIQAQLGRDEVAHFVAARVVILEHQNRLLWLVLCIAGFLVGIENIVCSGLLFVRWSEDSLSQFSSRSEGVR